MIDPQLQECRARFGEAPRRFSLWKRMGYLRPEIPDWIRENPLRGAALSFTQYWECLNQGKVVWGRFIQANHLLFSPGDVNCPGVIVYSLEDSERLDPHELKEIAEAIYSLKGTEPDDPELRPIAVTLTNEMIDFYGYPVPALLSPKYSCRISTAHVMRKHLPEKGRYLRSTPLPFVVQPFAPFVAFPLPSYYWPKSLIDAWLDHGNDR